MNKRTFGEGAKSIEPRWAKLSAEISRVVSRLLADRNLGKVELGRRLQYAQSTISNTLNNKQRWSFTLLLLVADELGVTLTDIINAAENGEEEAPWFELALLCTEPQTRERLTAIVRQVAPPDTSREVLELYFTAEIMEMSVPSLASDYLEGRVTDGEIFRKLRDVYDNLEEGENFWVKVSQREGIRK